MKIPEEAMPDLIRFIHKSTFGVNKIIKTFRTHWGANMCLESPHNTQSPSQASHPPPADSTPVQKITPIQKITPVSIQKIDSTPKSTTQHKIDSTPTSTSSKDYENASRISRRQMEKKIQSIAVKEIRPPIAKAVWYVHDAVLKQYGFEKEDFTPLVPNGSPFLSTKSAAKKAFVTPETPKQQVSKRKTGHAGKSLLDFLSREKSQIFSPPKRLKIDPSAKSPSGKCNDVIVLDPPDSICNGPPTKRPCLDTELISSDPKNKMSEISTTSTEDVIILDLPDSTSDSLTKASQVAISDDLDNGGGMSHGNSMASNTHGIQCL